MSFAAAVKASPRSGLVGLLCLLVTTLGWGLNWPLTKLLLQEFPPLTARGVSGIVASLALACLALSRGEALSVPRRLWPKLGRAALLNITAWMGMTTASLLWLSAGEAVTLAYTMPVWATLFAWPLLREKPTPWRILAVLLGFGSIVVLVGGTDLAIGHDALPGLAVALTAAVLFAFGTVMSKRDPLDLPPVASTAWQVGLGCIPLLVLGALLERPDFRALSPLGWSALVYAAAISLGLCYLTWFAALRRLPAGTAAVGTLLTPVTGVLASAIALGEPLGPRQLLALGFVVIGVALTVRR